MQLTDGEDLRNTVLNAPIGICILDADTFVAEIVNDKFLEVAGKPYEAIYNRFYWEPFAEARVYYEAALEGVVKTGEAYYANEVELMLIRHRKEENIFVTFVEHRFLLPHGTIYKIAVVAVPAMYIQPFQSAAQTPAAPMAAFLMNVRRLGFGIFMVLVG